MVTKVKGSVIDAAVSVKDFGAVGDGVTDDTAAIQAAEDSGKKVYFPAATYIYSSSITRSTSSIWIGEGPEKTILRFTGTGDNSMEIGGLDFMRTVDMQFVSAAGKASATEEVAVRHGPDLGAVFISYENCIFDGWSKAGFYVTRGWNVQVNNCYFIRCGDKGVSGTFTGGVVFDRTGSGTSGWSGSGFRFNGTTFIGCEYGIYNDAAWNVECNNVIFEDMGTSFYKSANGAVMTLNQCWFEDCDNQADIQGAVIVKGGRAPQTTGHNPSSGINFDGVSGASGRVMFQDADVIEHYTDATGTPTGKVDFTSTGMVVTGDVRPNADNTHGLGSDSNRYAQVYSEQVYIGAASSRFWSAGSGSPEGVVTASPGSLYTDNVGGAGTTLYVKESGTGNTGWVAK